MLVSVERVDEQAQARYTRRTSSFDRSRNLRAGAPVHNCPAGTDTPRPTTAPASTNASAPTLAPVSTTAPMPTIAPSPMCADRTIAPDEITQSAPIDAGADADALTYALSRTAALRPILTAPLSPEEREGGKGAERREGALRS